MFRVFRAAALGSAAFAATLLSAGQADAQGAGPTIHLHSTLASIALTSIDAELPAAKREQLASGPKWMALSDLTDPKASTAAPSINSLPSPDQEIKGQVTESKPSVSGPAAAVYAPRAALGQGYLGEVEPNNTSATATPISGSNVVVSASVYPNADVDFYSFSAAAGDRIYAAVMSSFSANASSDSQLRLLASDGTTSIEFDDDDGSFGGLSSSIAGATIPSAGTYFLQVNHFSLTGQLRPYELHLRVQSGSPVAETEPNDTPATANPLPASGWVSGARNPAAATEQDWYSFNLNAGDTVYLSLDSDPERDGVGWNGRLGVALFGDASNQILVVDDAGTVDTIDSEALFMTVKTAGTYFAFVDSASAATGGPTATYGLSVSVHPATNEGVNCTTYTSTDVPKTIGPGTGLVSSVITVPGNPRIADLNVDIVLNHALMQDIDAHLRSPAGNDNGLFTDIGAGATGGQAQMDVVFDDEAGIQPAFSVLRGLQLKPELAYRLAWFDGENAGGTWTLDLRDDMAGANGGTLTSWSLRICEPPPPPSCPPGSALATAFSTDFESGAAGFTHSGTADEWELGLPSFAPITTCNSGTNCWKTDLDNTYDVSSNQDLLSPNINLANLTPPITVSWAQRYQMENTSFDRMFVDFQQAGGATPVRLFEWLDATMTNAVGNPSATIQESAGWGQFTRRADSLAGLNTELRFHLDSDTTVVMAGLAIDDVSVTGCRLLSSDLSITKTDGVATAVPGGNVTYTITGSNAGPDPVTGATVADTFPAVETCNWTCVGAGGGTCTAAGAGNINDSVNLPAGGSVTYTATCAISASATGSVSNTATISSSIADPNSANNSATDIDTLTPQADLSITKTDGVATATPGGSVTYTIVSSNAGPSNAPGTTVADTFPATLTCNWTCVGAGGGTCSAGGSGNISDVVNLPAGGSTTHTAVCAISAAATGSLVNTATVAAGAGVTETNPANNSATDTDTLLILADLSISKTDGLATINPGGTTTYTITSSNSGPQAIAGAVVSDTFPAELTCNWTCAGAGGGTCGAAGSGNINEAVNLPAGGSVTHTATCTVAPGTPNGTVISNIATIAAPVGASDPNGGNNSATDNTTVVAGASVSGTKTVSGTTQPGGAITYTIVLTNAGPGAQGDNPGDEFVDVLPTQVSYVSSTASSGAVSEAGGVVSWNGAIPAGGSVTITINAQVSSSANGAISNQGTINFDSDGNGDNDASALTDDPSVGGATDPTGFLIARDIPTLGTLGLILMALGLVAIWYRRERELRA